MVFRFAFSFVAFLLLTISFLNPSQAEDWPQFRGPGGAGVSTAKNVVTKWSESENIKWKIELPGFGASSPIVYKDRIYLTCYNGYGLDERKPGDQAKLTRHLVCYDAKTGKEIWSKAMAQKAEQRIYKGFVALHGYTSSTPAIDDSGIYVFYGASGAAAYDHDGELLWNTSCGTGTHVFGTANSPVIYDDMVIINASVESGSLIGLEKKTGKEKWRQEKIAKSWNTPALVPGEMKAEVVVNTKEKVLAFDAMTGKPLWNCTAIDDYICPSVLYANGMIYAIGARKNSAVAIRPGGTGDVTDENKLWQIGKGSNVSSPVFHDGHLYWASETKGIVYCAKADSGELVYQERLDPSPGRIYASPVVADGKIVYVSRDKGAYVIPAKPDFELLAHNVIEGDNSIFNGSPAFYGEIIILRSDKNLYSIGK